MRRLLLLAAALLCLVSVPPAQAQTPAQKLIVLSSQIRPVSLNFLTGSLPPQITFSRSSGATSALYTDSAAATFTTYGNNVPRLSSLGLLIEQASTNFLLNSGAPVTLTTGSLGTGTYVFFCNGTGSVTSTIGTAVATGIGLQGCSTGTFQTITVTVAGTLTFTVAGSVNWFDLQAQAFPTSHIVTAGATATRSADAASISAASLGYNQNASSFVAQFIIGGTNQFSGPIVGASSGGQIMFTNGGTGLGPYAPIFSDGTTVVTPSGTAARNAVVKMGIAWATGSAAAAVLNGGTVAHESANVVTTSFFAPIGLAANGNGVNQLGQVWFQKLTYIRRKVSDVQIQAPTR